MLFAPFFLTYHNPLSITEDVQAYIVTSESMMLFFNARLRDITLRFFFKFVSRANCSKTYRPIETPRKQKM